MLSQTEENYLKAIFSISQDSNKSVSTNNIAEKLHTKASSVTDMIKKLSEKGLIDYKKYQGASLTEKGRKRAIKIVRKHRLWEVFLVEKLDFNWGEVHEIAEQLEHIKSDELTERLDKFLKYPTKDPHGDPIPDSMGNIPSKNAILLSNAEQNNTYNVASVKDNSRSFLQFLEKHSITIDSQFTILEKFEFDDSITIKLNNKELTLSKKVCSNMYVNIT